MTTQPELVRLRLHITEPLRVQLNSIAWRNRRSMADEITIALERHVENETKKAPEPRLGNRSDASHAE